MDRGTAEDFLMDASQGIQRTSVPTANYNMPEAVDCEVVNESGEKVKFGELIQKTRTIVIFIRHFLCWITSDYMEDLAKITPKTLESNGIQLVVIGCGPHKFIKSFREYTGYKLPLYTDPEGSLYKVMGCVKMDSMGFIKGSRHVKTNPLMGLLRSTWRAMNSATKEWQGDTSQQGGAFVIGPGPDVLYAHIDANSSDHAPINELLSIAGARCMNFPKDKVIEII